MQRLYREREIMRLPGANERWENWVQYTTGMTQQFLVSTTSSNACAGRLVPNFTQNGYAVGDVPAPLFEKLKVC